MKNAIIATLIGLASQSVLAAPLTCFVQGESTPNHYDRLITMVQYDDSTPAIEITRDDGVTYFVTSEKDGSIVLNAYRPSDKRFLGAVTGNGKLVNWVLPDQKRSFGCTR